MISDRKSTDELTIRRDHRPCGATAAQAKIIYYYGIKRPILVPRDARSVDSIVSVSCRFGGHFPSLMVPEAFSFEGVRRAADSGPSCEAMPAPPVERSRRAAGSRKAPSMIHRLLNSFPCVAFAAPFLRTAARSFISAKDVPCE